MRLESRTKTGWEKMMERYVPNLNFPGERMSAIKPFQFQLNRTPVGFQFVFRFNNGWCVPIPKMASRYVARHWSTRNCSFQYWKFQHCEWNVRFSLKWKIFTFNTLNSRADGPNSSIISNGNNKWSFNYLLIIYGKKVGWVICPFNPFVGSMGRVAVPFRRSGL